MGRALRRLVAVPHVLLLPLLSASCGSGTEPPPPPRATKLLLVTAPSATAETMVPLGTQPVLQTADASGTAVATTATITAEVVSDSGVVMAGGSATTDASGRVVFSGLTLGAFSGRAGALTLRFAGPGLEPVTAGLQLRCAVLPLAIGPTVNSAITTGDCTFHNGELKNIYEITTSQPLAAVQLTVDVKFQLSALSVHGPNEPAYYWGRVSENIPDRYGFKALLAQGRSRIAVSSLVPGRTGSYALTAAAATEDLTCDALEAMATSPITTSQQLATGDCLVGSFLEDRLEVGLPPNASITASMTSSTFQPRIRLMDATTEEVVADATADASASLVFANGSTANAYFLVLSSDASGNSGPYTLSVNITYPAAGAVTDATPLPSLPMLDAIARSTRHSGRLRTAHVPAAAP